MPETLIAAATLSTELGAGGGGRKYIVDVALALAEWATEIGREVLCKIDRLGSPRFGGP